MASAITRNTLTDDTGAGTDGTIWNNAFHQDLFDRIDAMFSGGGAYATLALGGALSLVGVLKPASNGTTLQIANAAASAALMVFDTTNMRVGIGNSTSISSLLHLTAGGSMPSITTAITQLVIQNNASAGDGAGMMFVAGASGGARIRYATSASAFVDSIDYDYASRTISMGRDISIDRHLSFLNSGSQIYWTAGSIITNISDGKIALLKNSGSTGVNLDVATDGRLTVTLRGSATRGDIYASVVNATGGFVGNLTGNVTGTASGNLVGNGYNTVLTGSAINELTTVDGLVTHASH